MKIDKDSALTLASDKPDAIFFDDDMPGFGVRVRAGGRRTWICQFRVDGKQRRVSLGDVRKVPLAAARKGAEKHFAQATLGDDVQAKKAADRAKPTVGEVVDLYLAKRELHLRPSTFREVTRYLRESWKSLYGLKIHRVELADVAAGLNRIAKVSGSISADRAKSVLSKMFSWAMGEGLCSANPTIGTNRQAGKSERDRVLSNGELAAIWRALPESDYGRIVRLLMLTGCRREEIGALRWIEIDLEKQVITLPASRTKNKIEHKIYLSDAAMAVLAECQRRQGRDLVFGIGTGPFSGWAQAKSSLDTAINKARGEALAPWVLHDIRRSVATGMAELKVLPHIVEQVLNHQSGHKRGVAGTYNWAVYEPQVRAALTLWSDHIKEITGGTAKVVPLRTEVPA